MADRPTLVQGVGCSQCVLEGRGVVRSVEIEDVHTRALQAGQTPTHLLHNREIT